MDETERTCKSLTRLTLDAKILSRINGPNLYLIGLLSLLTFVPYSPSLLEAARHHKAKSEKVRVYQLRPPPPPPPWDTPTCGTRTRRTMALDPGFGNPLLP